MFCRQTADDFGTFCANPACFQCVLHAGANNARFEDAVRAVISAGGDNCSRNTYLGALMGALTAGLPDGGIPAEWLTKTVDGQATKDAAAALLA